LPIAAKLSTLTCTLGVVPMCRPFYIGQKISHQLLHIDKPIGQLRDAQVFGRCNREMINS
jgi:hypothetical protein